MKWGSALGGTAEEECAGRQSCECARTCMSKKCVASWSCQESD